MEATAPILARFGLRESPIVSQVQALTPHRPQTSASSTSLPVSLCAKNSARQRTPSLKLKPLSNLPPLKTSSSSSSQNGSDDSAVRWVLDPIGDGDSRHIGYKVPMPGAFEIVSGAVIGRVPEKADLVLPVATVSGLHARLESKNGVLLVTDLDSTNGTYVDEKKLRPGAVTAVSPGSIIIFGDIHLAMFRVSKVVSTVSGTPDEADKEQVKTETPANVEPTS
ncbi:hypothetical protein H6P81_003021 [Aristolochia fimbriata]|uniref:FHA domain-containing protein n=1 Tax=Aristolochia fimbriata TaxID=158543 RepID=A0AAV7FBM1_ARIFI|nr:hypothetical protein H6P81_003021 [Aristolochia fimbriata]